MPELPDVVVYIRALEARLVGKRLTALRVSSPFVLRSVSPAPAALADQLVTSVHRSGKRIVIGFEGDLYAVIHLMIAGRLHWRAKGAKIGGKISLAAFDFPDGTLVFTEAATKKRASLHLVQGADGLEEFARGGVEPLEADLSAFRAALAVENHTLKRSLTDPRLFSGIGNAYSDEILHRAKLSPVRLTSRITDDESARLYHATREVLEEWVERLESELKGAFPEKVTAFRPEMAVHGRYGQPCPVCGDPVQRISYADNESNYCATCQTGGKLLADRGMSRLLKTDWPRTLAELEERRGQLRDSSA